jgi:hypothetical protein
LAISRSVALLQSNGDGFRLVVAPLRRGYRRQQCFRRKTGSSRPPTKMMRLTPSGNFTRAAVRACGISQQEERCAPSE